MDRSTLSSPLSNETGGDVASDKPKAFSSPLPLRAIGDQRLAGLDLRTLACVAAHDHMSLKLGKGRGCHASHETLAAKIACNYINLGKSIRKLEGLGYLECDRQPGRGNYHTYRIPSHLYDHEESLSFHQPSSEAREQASAIKVGHTANDFEEKICLGVEENPKNSTTSPDQYISLNDERYLVETTKNTPLEEARLEARSLSRSEFADNVGGQLARFERAWKENPQRYSVKALKEWSAYCEQAQGAFELGDPEYGQAQRLAYEIADRIDLLRNGRLQPTKTA